MSRLAQRKFLPALLRKQEPRTKGATLHHPGLLPSQEHAAPHATLVLARRARDGGATFATLWWRGAK